MCLKLPLPFRYSANADSEFKKSYSDLYRSYQVCSKISRGTQQAGFLLAAALTALNASLQAITADAEINTICTRLNAGTLFFLTIVWGLSNVLAGLREKDVMQIYYANRGFFDVKPPKALDENGNVEAPQNTELLQTKKDYKNAAILAVLPQP